MELPVTLIVKAPNQQVEDQTIQCELSWTINKLKQHLSEVYPSKPPKHEQKLIYSGKLLSDSVVLKDVLRQYDGENTHTVHLVCSPKYTINESVNRKSSTASTSTEAEREPTVENIDQRVPNMQWYQNYPQNVDPQTMQMIMMQQAAFMHYFSQYQYHMSIASQQGMNISQTPRQHPMSAAAAAATLNQQGTPPPPENVGQQPHQQAEANNVNNPVPAAAAAAAVGADAERDMNRDWLDVFYMLSRIMIFISIVYFYSSPVRCLVVLILGLSLYLYQVGFFRNVNINNNNIVRGETAQEVQAPTRLMVIWTFFTTFFASLLPEIPNMV